MARTPEDKNGALLPRRVSGEYVLLHVRSPLTHRADIWLSRSNPRSPQLDAPDRVVAARPGGGRDFAPIGIGPLPNATSEGWLVMYDVRQTAAGALYRADFALLDLEEPTHVRRRCAEWIIGPREEYELP